MRLIFDIETVRQYKHLTEAPIDMIDAWQHVAKSKYPDLHAEASYEKHGALFPEFAKVVVISAIDNKSKKIVSFDGMEFNGENAEFALLKNFKDKLINGDWKGATLVGHYIKGFDIPFLNTRFVINDIELTSKTRMYGVKPWEMYHIDTWEAWRGGAYKSPNASSLVACCAAMGIESPKQEMSGADVSDVYFSDDPDRMEKIKTYCEADVMATAKLYNKMLKLKML